MHRSLPGRLIGRLPVRFPVRVIRRLDRRRVPLLALALVGVFVGFLLARDGSTQEKKAETPAFSLPKFLLVTRHCEKDPHGDPRDAGLSEQGRARAAALAKLVGPAGVRHVFSSEYKRAQETAAALKGPHVAVHTIPAADEAFLFKALDEVPGGETALVIGHSNTVPAILGHFGYRFAADVDGVTKPVDALAEDDFGSLFVMTIPDKSSGAGASAIRLHYGD
jgi:phosphohistidine phosphatase SixA